MANSKYKRTRIPRQIIMPETILIAGAGHAAGQTAVSLRMGGFEGNITIIGDEPYPPYQRPPLSKKFLAGEMALERLLLRQEQYYADHGIGLVLATRVESIKRDEQRVVLDDGSSLSYDKLVLATGTYPVKLDLPGCDLPGIHYLRSADDVLSIQADFEPGRQLTIIGAGYIGMEVAAVAVTRGLGVTVIEMADRVLSRVASPLVSDFFEKAHREAGVDIRCGVPPGGEFQGTDSVEYVVSSSGEKIPADLVIIGVGIRPAVEIAEAAGLLCDNGIVVDEYCCTGDPNILAVGDCTNHPNDLLGRRLRLESVHNAQEQAKTAAATLLGKRSPYSQIPWFWSDQYDLKLQTVGLSAGYDQTVVRGDPEKRSFAVFYCRDGVLISVDAINSPLEFMQSKKLIAKGARIEPEILGDVDIPFKELAATALAAD